MESRNDYPFGANWSGTKINDTFLNRGTWEMGYTDEEQPRFAATRDGMQPGDRVALKSRQGDAGKPITIHALGIVKELVKRIVYIDWVVRDLDREVKSHGVMATIHEPYSFEEKWVRKVFCL